MESQQTGNCARQGAVAIEAALILPMLLIVTFGAIDIAQYINLSQQVANASGEAARIAIRAETHSASEVEAAVERYLGSVYPSLSEAELDQAVTVNISASETVNYSDPQDVDGKGGSSGATSFNFDDLESGDPLIVEVSFDFSAVRWIAGPDYCQSGTHVSRTVCRRQ